MTDRRLDLARGEAEVAVRMHEPGDGSLVARKIADSPWAIYASQSYMQHHGRPQRWEDLDHHASSRSTVKWLTINAGRWLRTVAPRARIAARGNSMLGVLAAVKSGAGLAPLPMLLGGSEDDLEPVLAPVPELDSKIYLVMHSDLRHNARVRAFCDFVVAEMAHLRPLLLGEVKKARSSSADEP